MNYPLPNPAYQWRDKSKFHITESDLDRWILYCDGMIVRDTWGYPIVFATAWDAKAYAKDQLQFNELVLTIS